MHYTRYQNILNIVVCNKNNGGIYIEIIKLENKFRNEIINYIDNEWGTPIVTKGNIIDITGLPGFIAVENENLAGALLYQIKNDECEIVVLYNLMEGKNIGTKLINAVIEQAKEKACKRIWLITTNDNTSAIRYYQKRGFTLNAIHINAFRVTQQLKGEFGEYGENENGLILGIDDIPILHEIEFEIIL